MAVRRMFSAAVALSALSLLAACSAPEGPASPGVSTPSGTVIPSGPIEGTWVDVDVSGDTVSLPLSPVEDKVNTHFSVMAGERKLDFMAYVLGGTVYVRANACPPCRSRGFALDGDILVCDACATTFKAKDGSGIQGACVDYPKAAAAFEVAADIITMSLADLVAAYEATLIRG